MSNLFASISTGARADVPLEIAQPEFCHEHNSSSSNVSAPAIGKQDALVKEQRPVKRDLLSFMSQKATASSASEEKVSNVATNSVDRKMSNVKELDRDPNSSQCEKFRGSRPEHFGNDIINFVSEEYGKVYESEIDVSAIVTTTLALTKDGCRSRALSSSDFPAVQASLPGSTGIQIDSNRSDSDKTFLRNYSGSSTVDPQPVDITESSCTNDSETSPEEFNLISAVESFTSAIDQEQEDGLSDSKKLKTTVKPSKIEFSVSQSASTYHKWKSSVSVPEELVRKLPKPAVQPRLPPELAQSHSGPHVLKSSLNIDFKKQATTKAELRISSLPTVDNRDGSASVEQNQSGASETEKPPVKLVIKTLSRESKPQRVVIISCSSSARRETNNRPNDDSDSDSSGRNLSNFTAYPTHSASVSVPRESADSNSGSGQSNQSGTGQTRSLCFCSMQPVVKLSKIDSAGSNANALPLRSISASTWSSLQGLFYRFCATQKRTGESQGEVALNTKPKVGRDTPSELKRLTDSSGFCAFANIPDKRESTKIAALYRSAILAPKKSRSKSEIILGNCAKDQKSLRLKTVLGVKEVDHQGPFCQTKTSGSSKLHLKTIRHKIRIQRRAKFRHFRGGRSLQAHEQKSSNLEASACKPSKPKALDTLVAASFRPGTEEPTVDHLGRSSLHVAMSSVDDATLEFIINLYKGRNLDCHDNEGLTPLMLACRNGNVKAASLLLAAGASNSFAFPGTGNSPLHEAILQSNLPLVKLLVEFGADLTTKNATGLSAIDLPTTSEISKFLRNSLAACPLQINPCEKIRIIHSERKLPTVYVLSFPDHPIKKTPCVIKSELCNSLGVSPEYFDVHYSKKMKSYVLDNSVILSRIISPHLKESFELSSRLSNTTTLMEIDDEFSNMFHQYILGERSSNVQATQQWHKSLLNQTSQRESSPDTDEMTDEDHSEPDECEIRRDDIKEVHRSIEKLNALEQMRRFNLDSSFLHRPLAAKNAAESTANIDFRCQVSSTASSSLDCQTLSVKNEPIEFPDSQEEQQPVELPKQQNPKSSIAIVPFVTPRAGYQLQTSEKKVPEILYSRGSFSLNMERHSDNLGATPEDGHSSFAAADLDLDECAMNCVPIVQASLSRRKTHPLTCAQAEKSVKISAGSESTSAPCLTTGARSSSHYFMKASSAPFSPQSSLLHLPASQIVPSSQSSSAETDASPSLFRVNVLPRVSNSTKQPRTTVESVFSPTRVLHDSKILRPSALVRVLKPTLTSYRPTKPVLQGLHAPSATVASTVSTSKSSATIMQNTSSRLFLRGQFKPIRVVVSPSNKATPQSDTRRDSQASLSAFEPLGSANF